jgi:hypothetical protein
MRRLGIFLLLTLSLRAATYYVSSAGNDSSAGSLSSPWLTINHAVNSVACGDTIIVVANGSFVAGDANLPYFAACGATTTIQSSALASFRPVGWRTNPVNDAAAYGKLQFAAQGIVAAPEEHGSGYNIGNGFVCDIGSITGSTITIGYCSNGLPNLANGSQVEFEINSENASLGTALAIPVNLTILQHYYVVNCSSACGTTGSTFQVAATSGGTAIAPGTCNAACIATTMITQPLQVNTTTSTITSPDAFTAITRGTPIFFGAVGFQLNTQTSPATALPAPLQPDTVYYPVNVVGSSFQVSATSGGPAITLTTAGIGPSVMATANLPNNWAFRGLELVEKPGSLIYGFFVFGTGGEPSMYGMVNHMEVDRCYIHDQPGDTTPPARGIAENGTYSYFHDNYIAGIAYGEAQAIAGWGSPGPTRIINNFLEASGENTLYGGNWNGSGLPNANKLFQGNYYYKPPVWKVTSNTGAASGACLYDSTDPNHSGGEWYTDTGASQNYQCSSSGTWAATTAAVPAKGSPFFKDLAEHKNGQNFVYSGNLFNYSWAQAQSGEAFNNNQEQGSGPGMANDHITVINNAIYNVFQFAVRGSSCAATTALPCIYFPGLHAYSNNLVVVNALACGVGFTTGSATCGYHPFQSTWGSYILQGDLWTHNTIYTSDSFPFSPLTPIYGNSPNGTCTFPAPVNLENYQNNIVPGDFTGDCDNAGSEIAVYYTNSTFANNVIKGGSGNYSSVGATNSWSNALFPLVNSTIAYVNASGTISGDYHLNPSSPYSAENASHTLLSNDGTDLGADIDAVNMETSGAAAGAPAWNAQAGLTLSIGSTQMIFSYTAPTSAACTATIYNAPARIPANQVTTSTDLATVSVSDGPARQLYVSGLPASTQFWYKLACGGGVLMVGDFQTRSEAGRTAQEFTFDWSAPTAMRYSPSRDMSGAVSLAPASRQFIPVGANSVVYAQVGTNGPITILIAP